MGAQSSKHADILESVANNDPRRLRAIFNDRTVSPLLLIHVLSKQEAETVFTNSPKPFEKRPEWKGISPLHFTAEQGNARILKEIVALLQDCPDRTLELPDGKTTTFADVWGQRDELGLSPLSRAIKAENLVNIDILAEAGANLNEAYSTHKPESAKPESWSYLRYVATKGLHSVLETLLNAGANFHIWGRDGRRPIHLAVEAGKLESVKILLQRDLLKNEEKENVASSSSETSDIAGSSSDGAKRIRAIANYYVRETIIESTGDTLVQSITAIREGAEAEEGTTEQGNDILDGARPVAEEALRNFATAARNALRTNSQRGGNLLHLACTHSHAHILEHLLSVEEFAQSFEEMNDSGKTPVFMAIRHSSLECLKLLVDAGADVRKKDIENWTTLHEAVKAGDEHIAIVEYLINEFNLDVNAADDDGWTPIHVAARFSAAKAVDVLVAAGSNINATTEDRETAVLLASAQASSAEVLRKLLEHDADLSIHRDSALTPTRLILNRKDFKQLCILLDHLRLIDQASRRRAINLESRSENGDTLLHICVEQKSAEAAEKLLEIGAGANEKNHEGRAPLHVATKNGDAQMVGILLRGGADANLLRADGLAPIHIACDNGHVQVVAALIEGKCDLNLIVQHAVRYKGFSPLMFTSRFGNEDITRMLIDSGADVNLAKGDGFTALHLAALNGNAAVCKLLLAAGADFMAQDEGGYLPLQLATRQSQPEVVSSMLEANVDPDCCGKLGLTSLHVASYVCDARLIWVLIRGGANVNAGNSDRVTPLHVAAGRPQGRLSMQLLLANGADTHLRDKEEDTPLHNACYKGLYQNVRLLLRRGAEVSPVNEKGITPLHLAAGFGSEETVEALLRHGADVEARDQNRMTPYRVASDQKNRGAMVLLFRAMKFSLAEIAPRKTFENQSPRVSSDGILCVICQNSLSSGEDTRTLPCSHTYHDECILAWLGGEELLRHDSCPLCQQSVLPQETSPQISTSTLTGP